MSRDEAIFTEAIELPFAGRAAYLDQACGDDAALRARVQALLDAHEAAEGFLEISLSSRRPQPVDEKPGDVIGRYTLIRKLGEGGCGVVYLAEQTEPVRRRVALKVIKLGMDTRNVIARFEAERQALAMMDHPDIARVFDAGATGGGRPYFVMEFVDGVPITKFADEQSLPMAARLELFARVCLALQHAHQKGVIHRDLKPSNILVARHDGVPSPKVIDFGIAKATEGRLTEYTLFTAFDQFMGTPAYMSPEQAELREFDIDTRSDIYSLGVLLYELLTGRPPFDPKSLVLAGINEIRRIIREVDPPRPSTHIQTLADADRATVARLRGTAPAHLRTALRGDLDWIVMRCLEKDRARRYGTAQELADDVRRHLQHEPVAARPPNTLYRVKKFIARHRLACASAAAITAALVAGTIVSVRQATRAMHAERAAHAERDAATTAGRAEALARADAQRRQEQVEDILAFMLGDFRTGLQKAGQLDLLDAVGARAMSYFAALDPHDLTDTALARQAKALTQIGDIRVTQARYPDASAAFAAAYDRAATLAGRHPKDADMLFERAQAEYWTGFVHRRRGEFAAAGEWLARYRASAAALLALEGPTPRARQEMAYGDHNLAVLEFDRGNIAAARTGFLAEIETLRGMLAAAPADPALQFQIADASGWLGNVAEHSGQLSEALERVSAQAAVLDDLATQHPRTARWQFRLADSLHFKAGVLIVLGRRADAAENLVRARSLVDALVALDPKNRQWFTLQATLQLTSLSFAPGDPAAQAALDGTRRKLAGLVAAEPTDRSLPARLATAWRLEARWRFAAGRADAMDAAARALELGEALLRESRADDRVRGELAETGVLAGRIAEAAGNPALARQHWRRVLDLLGARLAESSDWRLLDPAARALAFNGQASESRTLIERLTALGYRPLEPWPESPHAPLPASPQSQT